MTSSRNYIRSWAPDEGAQGYIETHLTRFEKTLAITPPGGPDDRILEMGAYLQITPALKTRLGYGEVRGCYYGPPASGSSASPSPPATARNSQCNLELFDAEKDRFPYDDGISPPCCAAN